MQITRLSSIFYGLMTMVMMIGFWLVDPTIYATSLGWLISFIISAVVTLIILFGLTKRYGQATIERKTKISR